MQSLFSFWRTLTFATNSCIFVCVCVCVCIKFHFSISLSKASRGFWYGVLATNQNLGGTLAPRVYPPLIESYGWEVALFAPAVLTLVYGLAMSLSLSSKPDNGDGGGGVGGGDSDSRPRSVEVVVQNPDGSETPKRRRKSKRLMMRAPVSVSDLPSDIAPTPAKGSVRAAEEKEMDVENMNLLQVQAQHRHPPRTRLSYIYTHASLSTLFVVVVVVVVILWIGVSFFLSCFLPFCADNVSFFLFFALSSFFSSFPCGLHWYFLDGSISFPASTFSLPLLCVHSSDGYQNGGWDMDGSHV